jgi:uncharacterized membrane-anchored protein
MITSEGLEKLGFDPKTDFVLRDDGQGVYIKEWKSASPQPTEAEIEAAHAEWEAEHASTQYQRDRAEAYASIADQLDMQYWDSVNGTTTWADHIAAVKAAHPKP